MSSTETRLRKRPSPSHELTSAFISYIIQASSQLRHSTPEVVSDNGPHQSLFQLCTWLPVQRCHQEAQATVKQRELWARSNDTRRRRKAPTLIALLAYCSTPPDRYSLSELLMSRKPYLSPGFGTNQRCLTWLFWEAETVNFDTHHWSSSLLSLSWSRIAIQSKVRQDVKNP
jgi:hypothetical protein